VLNKYKPIKMQTLDLNKMGLAPMEQTEMQEQNGGFFPIIVCGYVLLTKTAVANLAYAGLALGSLVAANQHAKGTLYKK
jgi:hypothetical protein